jgi:hypothetical protein
MRSAHEKRDVWNRPKICSFDLSRIRMDSHLRGILDKKLTSYPGLLWESQAQKPWIVKPSHGNIVARNKIYFPGSKNVSHQIQKHLMLPSVIFVAETLFPCWPICFQREHFFPDKSMRKNKQRAKTNNTQHKKNSESTEITAVVACRQTKQ